MARAYVALAFCSIRERSSSCSKNWATLDAGFSRFFRYFLEVAHQGSLRRAAEAMHVSASAIGRQVLPAEAAPEMALYERLPTELKLTAAGEPLATRHKRHEIEKTARTPCPLSNCYGTSFERTE